MGVDACIYARYEGDAELPRDEWTGHPTGATYYDNRYWGRYWNPDRGSGRWPRIAAVLLELLAEAETVWYYGDDEEPREFTKADFMRFTAEYLDINEGRGGGHG